MTLKTLRAFCDVARQRSFSRAAALHGLSQSAVSQAVVQLESRLEVQPIDRLKRPIEPTPEGRVFYGGCREFVERRPQGHVRLDYPHPDQVYHSMVGEQANLGGPNGGAARGASVAGTNRQRTHTEAAVHSEAVSNA